MMKRKLDRTLMVLIAAATLALAAPMAAAEEPTAATPEMMEAMKAFAAYATPGAQHKGLAERAGSWKVLGQMRAAPGAAMQEFHGQSEVESIMGGRYLLERFQMQTPEGPFEGLGLSAFDNLTQQYTAAWIDSMSTGILMAQGEGDSAGKRINYTGQMPDPAAGSYKTVRSVEYWVDDRTRRMETYDTGPDGKEFLQMVLTYTRE